jgi:hypothetical protein
MNNTAKDKSRESVGPLELTVAGIVIAIFILAGALRIVGDRQMLQQLPSWESNLFLDLKNFSEKVERVSCNVETITVRVDLKEDAPWLVNNQIAIASAKSTIAFFHTRIAEVEIFVGSKLKYSMKYHVSSGIISECTNAVNSSP